MNTLPSTERSRARRSYQSDLRTAQARATRARIVAAAAEAFAERGYAGTSLAEIGRRAEVSTESVAANGPKRLLLFAALEHVLGGREGADPVSARPEAQEVLALDRAAMLDALADLLVSTSSRSLALWRVVVEAAAHDPEIARRYAEMLERRRDDYRMAVGVLAGRGMLGPRVDEAELADALALLSGPETYELLVRHFGWTEDRLRQWWVRTASAMLTGGQA
jgi:AcrR family transcriptional regulator